MSKAVIVLLNQLRDERSRKMILTAILIPVIFVVLFLTLIFYILTIPLEALGLMGPDLEQAEQLRSEYSWAVPGAGVDVACIGGFIWPSNDSSYVSSPFGGRVHPIYHDWRNH